MRLLKNSHLDKQEIDNGDKKPYIPGKADPIPDQPVKSRLEDFVLISPPLMPAIAPQKKPRKANGQASHLPVDLPHVVVVRVPMGRITPHPRNPRRGNVEHIRRSLEEFGQYKPLVIQESTGHILAGNHTYKAAQELGWTHIDVHYEDLDDTKADRLVLADNGTGDLAEWDQQELAEMLKGVGENVPGFDQDFLKQLERDLRAAGGAPDPGPQWGRAEELATEWGTKEGQIWTIPSRSREGKSHRLVCGDCTKAEVVERALAGARPKLMVTDPPYGVEYDPEWRDKAVMNPDSKIGFGNFGGKVRPRRMTYVAGDDRTDWTDAWALFPGDVAYIWHAGIHCALIQRNMEAVGFSIRAQIVWAKPMFAIARGHYNWQHEPCLYGVRPDTDPAWRGLPDPDRPQGAEGEPESPDVATISPLSDYIPTHDLATYAVRDGSTASWIGDHSQSTVWKIARDQTADGGHVTQKPLECMERPIRNHDGDVYDPFCGSGTTIIAAERQGRICYAIELLPECMGIILQRCKDFGLEPAVSDS